MNAMTMSIEYRENGATASETVAVTMRDDYEEDCDEAILDFYLHHGTGTRILSVSVNGEAYEPKELATWKTNETPTIRIVR